MTQPTDGDNLKTYETEDGSINLSCSLEVDQLSNHAAYAIVELLTGTFFCDSTTAQSLPLIPTDSMFAPVIALKAYSRYVQYVKSCVVHGAREPEARARMVTHQLDIDDLDQRKS